MKLEKPTIVILGSKGMLGFGLQVYFESKGYQLVPVDRKMFDAETDSVGSLKRLVGKAEVVINAIGIIKPEISKRSAEQVLKINGIFPRNLAIWCKKQKIKCFHITTDCVFSGKRGNYREDDEMDAIDLYGMTKAAGDVNECMTLRTSIIGEERKPRKRSLLEWLRDNNDKNVNGFVNHRWNGVTTTCLAEAIEKILIKEWYRPGIYHIFSPRAVSKYRLLVILNEVYNLNIGVNKIGAEEAIDRTLRSRWKLSSKVVNKTIQEQIMAMKQLFENYE